MPFYCYLIVIGGIVLWLVPFLKAKWGDSSLVARDTQARWGMLFESLGLALMLLSLMRSFSPPLWRVTVSFLFFAMANVFSWTSARALGENLRFDAAIGTRHELVRHGPYAIVRHPIYSSFLCAVWGIGFMAATPILFAAATIVFLAGTEIRVRTEDRLLEEHFGDQARQFRRSTSAYIPFLR